MIASITRSQASRAPTSVVPGQVAECLVPVLSRDLPLRDAVVEKLADPAEALVEQRLVGLTNDGLVSRSRRDLRDPGAHEPTAEHTDGLNLHSWSPLRSRRGELSPPVDQAG